jgi:hypothetical protein
MALPTLDSVFASAADLPRRQMLAKWLVNASYSGSIEDYWTLPEHYLWAKIAVAAGATRPEADYISLPKNYIWSDLYNAVSGSSGSTIDRGEKEALGWIAAAVRGDSADPAKVATYINWPWRYQVASIITALAVDADAQSFITTSGATDIEVIDQFVKGIKALGLYNSMVCWPLRSSQNAGTGTTAYSLGGLGTFNGTLIDGPVWGANGITFDGANDRITTGAVPITGSNPRTLFAVGKSSTGNLTTLVSLNAGTGIQDQTWGILQFPNTTTATGWGFNRDSTIGTITASAFNSIAFGYLSSRFGYINGALQTMSGATEAPNTAANSVLHIGTVGTQWFYNGEISFVALLNTGSASTNIHNLYKSTLGTGLSLP